MFYSKNNDSYMQDLYYYNQIPNNTYMNNFGNTMLGNPNMPIMQPGLSNIPNNPSFVNQGIYPNNIPVQNLNNLYPSIYRILTPVVSRVVLNNNQPITEELLNNMTDTVFNIVEGQIDLGDDQIQKNIHNENQQLNSNSSNTSNSNSSNRTSETTRQSNQGNSNNIARNNKGDYLLRDLIKILNIKEFLSRNQFQRQYRK